MPLVRLEVCDFKSYRGHQSIGPFSSFTSVIGPNGAGKSNLMDAISFVLGVKSAVLRSSQLKDLVYRGRRLGKTDVEGDAEEDQVDDEAEELKGNGKEDREGSVEEDEALTSDADAKAAWVMAVFQDNDGKEWAYRRTISTTGSSTYSINSQSTSFQAYTASLATHNILTKAKNFLVFQGDVEHIASQSPKDLTRLIEQISGSLELAGEYERAKKAVDKATESATESFHKKRDLTGEIKVFKEQKGEADRFEALLAERDELILKSRLWKLYHISSKIQQNAEEIEERNTSLAGLRAEQAKHDRELDEARAKQAKARKDVAGAEKRLKNAEKALEGRKPDLVALTSRIQHETRRHTNNTTLLGTVQKDYAKQQERLASYQHDLEVAQVAAERARKEAGEAGRMGSLLGNLGEAEAEEYRALKAQANLQAVPERQAHQTNTREEKTRKRAVETLRDTYERHGEKLDTLKKEREGLTERKDELEGKVSSLQSDLSRVKQDLNKQASEYARISQLESELNEKLQDTHEKLLQAGVDRKESEKETRLKETLANLQRLFPGVRGRVVDLCKPTQRKYETAVSVVLGRNIDAVVVDEERVAIECIEYMRSQRSGQATFIPLSSIQVKPINDKFRSFAKGARLALDVIQFEPSVERAMHHACGNALVCDTMEVARHVVYERGQEVKAVTLEGTVIHKSGLITGGRSTQDGGKKWEDKDIQGLQRVRDALLSQLRDLTKSKPRSQTDEGLVAEMTRLESTLTLAKDDLASVKSRLDGVQAEIKHLEKEIKKMGPELQDAQKKYDTIFTQMQELEEAINAAEDRVYGPFCQRIGLTNIREYEQLQIKAAQMENEAKLKYDTQIARLTHQSNFEAEQLALTQERLSTLESAITSQQSAIAQREQDKITLEQELKQGEAVVEGLQEDLDGYKEILDEKTKDLENVKKGTSKASRILDQAFKDIASKNDEIEKLASERSAIYRKCRLDEVQLPLLSGNLKNVPMIEDLRDEAAMDVDDDEEATQRPRKANNYGIVVDFDALDEDEKENSGSEVATEFETQISKVTSEIEHLAPNMKAMTRLEDVETKLAATEKEADKARRDSKKARDDFNSMRKKRCDLFNKAFKHISERIDQLYKDLTKGKASPLGGVAYLTLEDSEEPYLGGVKYHAMPPMKRFRDMDQLSGGEKTVAALALLFAIHSYHPSPFFVLDEVDAALDNTNVARIANYIRQQAGESLQFIVISLKNSLYERGNSLVGIYRDQDVNSSRSLTLDLTQYSD